MTGARREVGGETIIDVSGVWKGYHAWAREGHSPREMLRRRLPALIRGGELRWALADVTVGVRAGECVGVIGDNGAGKSTLLRIGAGLSRATRGQVRTPASVGSVLALGEAFDLSLTGSENAYTTALLAGYRRREAAAAVPAVLEFAELERFAEEPVRTYSEGMRLRLAFGVVAQLRPPALLFDEVISVGDGAFQAKCLAFVRSLREQGTAVLLATHDLGLVDEHCDRAVWLDHGRARLEGLATEVTAAYRSAMHSETVARTPVGEPGELELRRNRFGSQEIRIERVELASSAGSPATGVPAGSDLRVRLRLSPTAIATEPPAVVVALRRASDGVTCVELNSHDDGVRVPLSDEESVVEVEVPALELVPGSYEVEVGLYRHDWDYAYDLHSGVHRLLVAGEEGKGVLSARRRWSFEA